MCLLGGGVWWSWEISLEKETPELADAGGSEEDLMKLILQQLEKLQTEISV